MALSAPLHVHTWLATQTLLLLAALAEERVCLYPRVLPGARHAWNTLCGRQETVQILLDTARPAFEAAYRALPASTQQILVESGVLQPPPPRPAAPPGRLRVVACGFVEVATGRFISSEDVPAFLADQRAALPLADHATQPAYTPPAPRPVFGQVPPPAPRASRRAARTPRRSSEHPS